MALQTSGGSPPVTIIFPRITGIPIFDIWFELPPILRALMGLAMIGIAVLIWFVSGGTMFACGLGAVGLVFLPFCGAGSNSGGYKF